MARICPSCGGEMTEECRLSVGTYDVSVKKGGFFDGAEGRLGVAVCPRCGTVTFYTDRPEQFRPPLVPEGKKKKRTLFSPPEQEEKKEKERPVWKQEKDKDPWE